MIIFMSPSVTHAAFPSCTLVIVVRSSRMTVIRAAGAKVATKLAKKDIHANCSGELGGGAGGFRQDLDEGWKVEDLKAV